MAHHNEAKHLNESPTATEVSPPRLSRRALCRRGSLSLLAVGSLGLVTLPPLANAGPISPVKTPTPTPAIVVAGGAGAVNLGSSGNLGPNVISSTTRPVVTRATPTPTPVPPGQVCSSWRGPLVGLLPNPFNAGIGTITVYDHAGNPLPDASIGSLVAGGFIGLDTGRLLEIVLTTPSRDVSLTLVHYNPAGAQVTAFAAGVPVASAATTSAQNVEHHLFLAGKGIDLVVIKSPQSEVLLLDICATPM